MSRSPWMLALALVAAGCETPTASTEPALTFEQGSGSAALVGQGTTAQAAGTAYRFPVQPDGSTLTVRMHFNATTDVSGTTRGFYTYDAGPTSLKVDVTCMTVVDGNRAWIAGVITESTVGFVGHVSYFYTFDNGEGAMDQPDIISLVRVEVQPGLGEAARFCSELPEILPPRNVDRGNVNVRG